MSEKSKISNDPLSKMNTASLNENSAEQFGLNELKINENDDCLKNVKLSYNVKRKRISFVIPRREKMHKYRSNKNGKKKRRSKSSFNATSESEYEFATDYCPIRKIDSYLIEEIMDYLSLKDCACFSVTSKRFYNIWKTSYGRRRVAQELSLTVGYIESEAATPLFEISGPRVPLLVLGVLRFFRHVKEFHIFDCGNLQEPVDLESLMMITSKNPITLFLHYCVTSRCVEEYVIINHTRPFSPAHSVVYEYVELYEALHVRNAVIDHSGRPILLEIRDDDTRFLER